MENKSKNKKGQTLADFLLTQWKNNYYEALEEEDTHIQVYLLGVGDGYADAYLTIVSGDAKEVFPDYEKITDQIINNI